MTDRHGKFLIYAVCLGNICRSPMAAAVLTGRFEDAGLGERVTVESAGTGGWHAGSQADPRAQAVLRKAGYSTSHTAQQFQPQWFADADLVLGMDYSNVQDLRGMAHDDDAVTKILIMRSFDPTLMHLPEDDPRVQMPDPYYGTTRDFKKVLDMIQKSADGVVSYVRLHLN